MTERLTTLAQVKDWLEITNDKSDASLIRLIDAASQFAFSYMNRDSFGAREYVHAFKGNGKDTTLLRNWPIIEVSSVGINGQQIHPATIGQMGLPSNGFTISDQLGAPQSINLFGSRFGYGLFTQVKYTAGYRTAQALKIPEASGDPAAPRLWTTAGGQWVANLSVQIGGVDATQVDENPQAGEYTVSEWGEYVFNDADIGSTATISYDYVPFDASQAVLELIGEWYRRKDRIGLLSKTLGGQETITFSQKDMNDVIRRAFDYYSNVVPI